MNRMKVKMTREVVEIFLRGFNSQVLGFLLLRSVRADLAATGGSGTQLRGEEGEDTLHHPLSTLN